MLKQFQLPLKRRGLHRT